MADKKRGQGEGTITYIEKKKLYCGRLTIGRDDNGKQKRKAIYGKTKKEVKEKMDILKVKINKGVYIEPSEITLGNWIETWMCDYKIHSARITSIQSYESYYRNNIKPMLGNIKIKDLRNEDIQRFVNRLTEKKLSATTIEKHCAVISMALDKAVENEMILKNPCKKVCLPAKHKKEARVLTIEEQKKLIEIALNYRDSEIIVFMLYTGLRLGEALALTWDDIDFDRKIIDVNKTQTIRRSRFTENGKQQVEFTPTKTKASNRKIPLLHSLENLLHTIKEKQDKISLDYSERYNSLNLVFCTREGKIRPSASVSYRLKMFSEALGMEHINAHALRHTFATRGLENGIEMRVMQDLLGHSTMKMTADLYTHVLPDKKMDSIKKLEKMISF